MNVAEEHEPKATAGAPSEVRVPWGRGERVALAAIMGVGLVLRIWFLSQIVNAPDFTVPQQDPQVQDHYARALVTGDWSVPPGEIDPEIRTTPYFRPPGHGYYLTAIYALNASYLAPRLVNLALGVAAVLLIALLGRAVYGRAAGLTAGLLAAIYPVFIYWEGQLNDPILFVFLVPCLMHVLRRWAKRQALGWAALAGLIFGAYALMRPNILAFGPVVALWMLWVAWRHRRLWRIPAAWCLLAACTLLVILPVTVRNYAASGDFVPISTYFGENLWIGNSPGADGMTPWTPDLQELEGTGRWSAWVYINVVKGVGRELGRPDIGHAEVSRYFTHKALAYMRDHPARTLGLMGKRFLLLWLPCETTCNKVVYYEKAHYAPLKFLPASPWWRRSSCWGCRCCSAIGVRAACIPAPPRRPRRPPK